MNNKSVGISLEIFDAKDEVLYNNNKVIVNIKDRLTEKVEIIQADIRFNEKYLLFYIHPVSDDYGSILFKGDSKYDIVSIKNIKLHQYTITNKSDYKQTPQRATAF